MECSSLEAEWIGRMLLQQSPASYWVLTKNLDFHRAWGNCSPLFHKSAEELPGLNVSDVFDADHQSRWEQNAKRALSGETLFLSEQPSPDSVYAVVHFPIQSDEGEIGFAGGFAHDVTRLGAAEPRYRNAALSVLQAQDGERKRMAQFLHDDVGQNLSVLGLQLDLLRMELEQSAASPSQEVREIQKLLETVMETVREFSYHLNPATVERAGLPWGLDRLVGRARAKFPGAVRLMADPLVHVTPEAALAIYKIAEQAMENAIQHSAGSLIEVLTRSTRNGSAIEVRDNGKGFDCSAAGVHRGMGFLIMEHHAAQAGLNLSVTSHPGQGTVVSVMYQA